MNILKPQHETLKIEGRISYSEGRRAWNLLRLKDDLLKEFPQLKERREKFSYKMVMHRTFEELKKAIEKMEKEGNLPLVLFFGRE